jgi:PAS domain S-box-containing protein
MGTRAGGGIGVLDPGDHRLHVLFESSPIGAVIVSLDGTVLAVNPAACRLWGRTEDELVGSPAQGMVYPDDRDDALGSLAELLDDRVDEVRSERRYLRPDGSVTWSEAVSQVIRAADGAPLYIQSVLVDVTERKAAEQARAWLEDVVKSSQDAIIGTTVDGIILNWNDGAERIFGYTSEEMVGRNATLLRPPGSEDETAQLTTRIGRGERIEHRVVRVRKDGTTVTLLASSTPIRDSSGAVVGTASVARDVGEKERADAIFSSLVEAAPDAMVCVDAGGVVRLVNAEAERLFGYARDELVGGSVETLVPDRASDVHPTHRERYFEHPVPRPMGAGQELSGRRKDGSEFPVEISLSAIRTEDGLLVSATIRDGTERRQAAIVASTADAVIGRDLDGTITSWNAGAERMYGYTPAEAVGNRLDALLPLGHANELPEQTARMLRGEPVAHYESKRRSKDGRVIDVSVTVSPIHDPFGTVVGTSSVARDITQSKLALEALRAAEARKSAILEAALDCVITIDHRGRVVEFNPAAERVFGYAREAVVGRNMAELIIPPSRRAEHAAGLERYLTTGEGPILGQRLELIARRADGSEFPVELAVTTVEIEGQPIFTGYLRDLTEQKRVQGELAESQQLLQAMLDNSPALITITDADGRYRFVNQRVADTFGIDRDEAVGRTGEDLWPPDLAADYRARDLEVLGTGQPLQYESVAAHPDGYHTYLTVKFPIFDAAGTAQATASIATDITELKRAEAERTLLGERLRQSERLESLGQLAGGVAHDFNNLLGAILNYASFVSEATVDQPSVHADVQQIRAAAERGARLTRQLLIVGRREAIRPETMQLNLIVADIRELLSRTIGEHIELVVKSAPALPAIRADRGQIEQILLNLAVNARDAMPGGGTLSIATSVADLDAGYVRLHPDAREGRHVELSVSDTGVGMAGEVMAHIFEPFFTTKPTGQGTGLGLATVYSIVAAAGGSLGVYSEPGIGSTFRVLLPASEEASVAPAPAAVDVLEGGSATVLLVEDEPAIMETTARILRRHGYTVLTAATGAEALLIAGEHDIQLLLTDSVMPQMSGRELAEHIAELRPQLPVLFMSGYSEGVLGPQRMLSEGAALVEKPFTAAVLLRAVRAAINTIRP